MAGGCLRWLAVSRVRYYEGAQIEGRNDKVGQDQERR